MKPTSRLVALSLLTLAGFIIRLPGLGDPISYDEAYTYVAFASQGAWAALSDYSLPNNHILHTLLVSLSAALLGNDLWAIRIPALLAGLACIPAAYAFGTAAHSPLAGFLGAALVAGWPALAHYASDARGYSLVALFTLLAFWLATRLATTPRLRDWALLSLITALGLWTIPLMLYPAGAAYIWLALIHLPHSREHIKHWLASGLGAGALTLALYTPALLVSGWRRIFANGFVQPQAHEGYFNEILWERLATTWQLWNRDVPSALSLLLTLGVILSLAFARQNHTPRIPLLLVNGLWVALYVLLRRPDAFDRFWSWALAPLLVWAAIGWLETATRSQGRTLRWQNALGILALLLVWAQAGAAIPTISPRWSKTSNAQAAAEALAPHLNPGDLAIIGYPHDAPMWYNLVRLGLNETVWTRQDAVKRVYIFTAKNQPSQTPSALLKQYGLRPAPCDLPALRQIGRFGQIVAYECPPKAAKKP